MDIKLKFKSFCIFLICILSIYCVLPNFIENKFLIWNKKVNLGLDLKGGSYILFKVDFDSYFREKVDQLYDEVKDILLHKKVKHRKFYIEEKKIKLELINNQDLKVIKDISKDIIIEHDTKNNIVSISYANAYLDKLYNDVIYEAIHNIQRRLDQYGSREITIKRQGKDGISLQVPGIYDTESIKSLIGKTAKLTFHLLAPVQHLKDINSATTIMLKDDEGHSYPVLRKVELSGDALVNSYSSINNIGKPVVFFKFNSIASNKFAMITKENIGKPFVIVLDNTVLTAPMIREPILGGQGEISGNFTQKTANELAVLLKSGALPAPLHIVEEKTIGPSLGAESINYGKIAAAISVIIVSIFIILAYGFFGVLASIALVFNIVFIFFMITALDATLTLPGIAGIALTVGMSVDANVLIFERIREEFRANKKVIKSIEVGFKNAMSTILDSNITTLIAAAIMFIIGSGPVSGFAITLSVGILCSMFSAITLTKLFIDLWVYYCKPKTLKI